MSKRPSEDTSLPRGQQPPEFFLDRSLGRGVADGLRGQGWVVHCIADFYPNDAQAVPDSEWVTEALTRGWAGLSKDVRVWKVIDQAKAVPVFSLSNGQLGTDEMVRRYAAVQTEIWRQALLGAAGLWIVYEVGRPLHRRYP